MKFVELKYWDDAKKVPYRFNIGKYIAEQKMDEDTSCCYIKGEVNMVKSEGNVTEFVIHQNGDILYEITVDRESKDCYFHNGIINMELKIGDLTVYDKHISSGHGAIIAGILPLHRVGIPLASLCYQEIRLILTTASSLPPTKKYEDVPFIKTKQLLLTEKDRNTLAASNFIFKCEQKFLGFGHRQCGFLPWAKNSISKEILGEKIQPIGMIEMIDEHCEGELKPVIRGKLRYDPPKCSYNFDLTYFRYGTYTINEDDICSLVMRNTNCRKCEYFEEA
jgi:hypothetical protein